MESLIENDCQIGQLPLCERLSRVNALRSEDEWAQGLLLGDEWANALTHALGFVLSLIGLYLLLVEPLQHDDHAKSVVLLVYGLSLILLYMASTIYHALRNPRMKKIFRTVDHCAIYLLIAGSYTPFTVFVLDGIWGWALFSVVWGLAAVGISCKILLKHRFKQLSTAVYLLMGWMVIVAGKPLLENFHLSGLYLLLAGGCFYTFGVAFYALDKRRFFHAIWHLFVLCGSVCHYVAVLIYV